MTAISVTLSPEEQKLMRRMLESALGETRVEVHRTHFSPDYREELKHEEQLLRSLLAKMSQGPA